jgi:hypothetical protein
MNRERLDQAERALPPCLLERLETFRLLLPLLRELSTLSLLSLLGRARGYGAGRAVARAIRSPARKDDQAHHAAGECQPTEDGEGNRQRLMSFATRGS